MQNEDCRQDEVPHVKLLSGEGTRVTGRVKPKNVRITEALADFRLVIDGCISRLQQNSEPRTFSETEEGLARASSIFMRKMVLGESRNSGARLLDKDVCEAAGLKFHSIAKVTGKRTPIRLGFAVDSGFVQFTKVDEPVPIEYTFPIAQQELRIIVDWPLPGTMTWTDWPSDMEPWRIAASELFDNSSESQLTCDEWLGQQLVMFDNKGVSLSDILRVTANTEGAHSSGVSRLMSMPGEETRQGVREQRHHILSNVAVCGVKYNHIVVTACALYLFARIIDNKYFERPTGDIFVPTICLVPEGAGNLLDNSPQWLSFQGGLMLAIGTTAQPISHRIRATR